MSPNYSLKLTAAAARIGICFVFLIASALTACETVGTRERRFYEFTKEKPPCHLAPLTDAEVTRIGHQVLGEAFFHIEGLPERPSRVIEYGCVYRFQYPIGTYEDQWWGFNSVDGTSEILVARDGSIFLFESVVIVDRQLNPPQEKLRILGPNLDQRRE